MRKLTCVLALFVAVAAVATLAAPPAAEARQKKDDKKAPEVGTIEVYQAKDGWRFRVKNADGKSVAIGTVAHDKKEDAIKDIDFLKATFAKAKVTEIKDDKK